LKIGKVAAERSGKENCIVGKRQGDELEENPKDSPFSLDHKHHL
jgi:hypothetical protein